MLDGQLGRAILNIERAARYLRAEQEAKAKRERLRLQEKRKRLRKSRLDWYFGYLVDDLESLATSWKASKQLLEFLIAYECALSECQTDKALTWLTAARDYAENLNPLHAPEPIAKDLAPFDEHLVELIAAAKAEALAGDVGPDRAFGTFLAEGAPEEPTGAEMGIE